MIWVDGKLVADDALQISVLDRTFEHGLGLFETLRTWNGRAPLLSRHLARLRRSASDLGLPIQGLVLPGDAAVRSLLASDRTPEDVILRITLSGGTSESGGAKLWMRTASIRPLPHPDGQIVAVGSWGVDYSDALARYKTLNYWSRRYATETTRRLGFDEVLSTTSDGRIWEGSRTNVFLMRGSQVLTPALAGPVVPGVMRGLVMALLAGENCEVHESDGLTQADIAAADEIWLTNSVRGVVPVARVGDARVKSPGKRTKRLAQLIAEFVSA